MARETRISKPISTDLTMEEKYPSSYVYRRIDSKVLREYVDSTSNTSKNDNSNGQSTSKDRSSS